MTGYLLVGIGGIFGSLSRYLLGRIIAERANTIIPIGTFFINITGAFLLGIVYASGLNSSLQKLFADGFLGAYTTFSTFMYEGVNLFQEDETLNALLYIICSLIIGIVGFIMGIWTVKIY